MKTFFYIIFVFSIFLSGCGETNDISNIEEITDTENPEIETIILKYQKIPNHYFPKQLVNSKTFYFMDNIAFYLNQETLKFQYAQKVDNEFYQNTEFLESYSFPDFTGNLNQILPLDYDNDGDIDYFLCSPDINTSTFWNKENTKYTENKILIDFNCIKSEYKNNELAILGSYTNEENQEVKFIKIIEFNKYGEGMSIELKTTYELPDTNIKDFHIDDIDKDGENEVLLLINTENNSKIKILSQNQPKINDIVFESGKISSFCLLDLENDGDKDIFGVSFSGQDELLLNDGFSYFFNYTYTSLPFDYSTGTSLICKDLNKDGFKDIVIGNYNYSNRLYINTQKSYFTDDTISLSTDKSHTKGIFIMDIDNDDNDEIIFTDENEGLKIYKLKEEVE